MTSISDRCKTAREKATPGPWEATAHDIMRSGWQQRTYDAAPYLYDDASEVEPHDADGDQVLKCLDPHWREMYRQPGDLVLAALAPEAADEVIRLTDALEALAEWHDNEAELTEHPGGSITRMELCNTHRHAAARICHILNTEGGQP